ncbi:MAG TPA: transglutaminase domain-containing protein [Acidimicrobiales bacterium]|nr:transglutaminase domain-containing protein [Acidimicrobiales bacterium]
MKARTASATRTDEALSALLALATAAAAFLAATPWLRAYQVSGAIAFFAAAALAPPAISGVMSRALRFGPVLAYATSATGLLVLLGATDGFGYQAVWDGLAHVPAQLLSETLPLSGSAYLLAAPIVLTWLCAAATAELHLRPARPSAAALGVPVAYFALSFAATTSAPAGASVAEGAGVLGALVVTALCRQGLIEARATRTAATASSATSPGRTRAGGSGTAIAAMSAGSEQDRKHSSVRRAATGAAAAAAVASVTALVVSSIPAFASKPASVSRPTQLLLGTVVNPLDELAVMRFSSHSSPPRKLFTVDVAQPWDGYVTVADLDDYDGDTWSFSDTFQPTGGRVPSASATGGQGTRLLRQRYRVRNGIGLPFLPEVDRPVQVEGLAVEANSTTGMLASGARAPFSYSVTSRAPLLTSAEVPASSAIIPAASVPGGASPAYTALPTGSQVDVAAAVRFAVNLTGRPSAGTVAFLQALTGYLRAHELRLKPSLRPSTGPIPAALAGTSLAQVLNAVSVDRAATPEQFATFVAMVMRYLGVPARVVTGFRVPAAATASGPLPPGNYTLTNRDAWAWAEVPLLGYGWVVVDPTPLATTTVQSAPPEQVTPARPVKLRQATALPGKAASHGLARPVRVNLTLPIHVNWLFVMGVLLPGAVIVVLVGGFLGVPAARRRLRRLARHQPGDPAAMAAGAWLEFVDSLSRFGMDIAASATSSEVVNQVGDRFGDEFVPSARVLGELADQALYSTDWPLDRAAAQVAWSRQTTLRRDLRRQVSRRDRAQALLLVGPCPPRPSTTAAAGSR